MCRGLGMAKTWEKATPRPLEVQKALFSEEDVRPRDAECIDNEGEETGEVEGEPEVEGVVESEGEEAVAGRCFGEIWAEAVEGEEDADGFEPLESPSDEERAELEEIQKEKDFCGWSEAG